MYVGDPLLPAKIGGKEVAETLSTVLKEKNWHEFKLATLKLTLVPYFLFNYHYYKEKEDEGEKIIESSVDGFLALNGVSVKVEEKTEKLILENINEAGNEAPKIEFEEKETNIDKREQDAVLQFKTAEFFGVPKNNVVISSAKRVLVPFYETFVEVKEGTFDIRINAITGDIDGIDKVPKREKGFVEITEDTLDDLKDPKMWLEYTKGLFAETGKYVGKKGKKLVDSSGKKVIPKEKVQEAGIDFSILTNKWVLIAIMIIAVFLIWIGIQAI